jgi:hypothetical protein
VGFLTVENKNRDPRYQYLVGIIEGLLLYDLSQSDELIALVDRGNLERVVDEQKLRLSGLIDDDGAVQVGKLIGADSLMSADFIFLGNDIIINLTVVDVETGLKRVKSERGRTENMIHSLAEWAVLELTGAEVAYRTPETDRSIISMRDETPGSIALYSNLVDAEIYLDGEFIAYTTGDPRVPYVIEDVDPGLHVVRTDLGRDFGVVKEPEITFHDWEEEIEVRAGKRKIVRADERHFNDFLSDIDNLVYESENLRPGGRTELRVDESFSLMDRTGTPVQVAFSAIASLGEAGAIVEAELVYAGEVQTYRLDSSNDEPLSESIGIVQLEISMRDRGDYGVDVRIILERSDVEQGMHRVQGKEPPLVPARQ